LTGRAAAQAALPRDSVSMPRMFQPMAVDEEGIAINTMQMIQNGKLKFIHCVLTGFPQMIMLLCSCIFHVPFSCNS
jgi:hypothetical protein